jgi:phospholipid transport system substrate-binding protein
MSLSRRAVLIASLPALWACRRAIAAEGGDPAAVIQHFYDDLLAVMREAKHLSFDERYKRLAPAVTRTFALALMSRLSVGPEWTQLSPDLQQRLTDVFSRYTISVYANRFDDFNGERFEVDANPTSNPNGMVVPTRMIKSNGETVVLNYLLRQNSGAWQAIDIYLSGTISELATRRSEFTSVLHNGGAEALVKVLEQRTAALRTG